nr:hypothetical protein [Tanacetum cinerariifolium]
MPPSLQPLNATNGCQISNIGYCRQPLFYLKNSPSSMIPAGNNYSRIIDWATAMKNHGVPDHVLKASFPNLVFEENYDTGTGDHYSLRQICDQFYIQVFDCDDDAISQSLISWGCIKDFWMAKVGSFNKFIHWSQYILGDIWKGKVTSSDVSYNQLQKVRSFDNILDAKELWTHH